MIVTTSCPLVGKGASSGGHANRVGLASVSAVFMGEMKFPWPANSLALPVTVVIPGHGERTDAGLVQHILDVLAPTPLPAKP